MIVATGSKWLCTASIVAFPHRPQLELAKTWRVRLAKPTATCGLR
ncbi:MAG: hypothetical protein WD534_03055 [Phycisphaeraceae bacterium]